MRNNGYYVCDLHLKAGFGICSICLQKILESYRIPPKETEEGEDE